MKFGVWIGIWFVILWGIALVCFIFSGCVSLRANQRDKTDATCSAMRKCRSIAYYDHALNAVQEMNKRFKTQCP